jgi:hypothetical protein
VFEAYIDDADATAEKYSGPTEYNLKTMLLSRYGLRADDDEPTRREVYENLLGRLEKLGPGCVGMFQRGFP